MDQIVERIERGLKYQGLDVAMGHFRQAEDDFGRGAWEAANGQYRTFLEALFDAVAAIRLKTSATGGQARKQLQSSGVLSEYEGKLVQSIMETAGEKGSHPGLTEEDAAFGRRLIVLGAALIGLQLIPEVVRVQDVLSVVDFRGHKAPTDRDVVTQCPTCGETQDLAEASIRRERTETVYECVNGCQPIVVIGEPGDSPWPGRGYRLESYVIRNARDLYIRRPGRSTGLTIPASSAALMKKRPGSPEPES